MQEDGRGKIIAPPFCFLAQPLGLGRVRPRPEEEE